MKRMTSKQIEFEAGKILGATWKKREKKGPLVEQLRAVAAGVELSEIDRESVQYLIDAAEEVE